MSHLRCIRASTSGRWLGQDEVTAEERRQTLEKFGFEWRLRIKDDEFDMDGNEEEFIVLCEGLSVRGGGGEKKREKKK